MAKPSDEQLFDRLTHGDVEALEPLMERYGDACTLYVNGYLHDLDMAEELMMESFSRMLLTRPRLREGGFKPYLYKTARNLAVRHLSDRKLFMSFEDLPHELAEERQLEESIIADERNRELYDSLDRIPADYREALYLVYLENMSYDEAGAVMRKSRKQVDNLVQRGKAAMRSLMEEGTSPKEADGCKLGNTAKASLFHSKAEGGAAC